MTKLSVYSFYFSSYPFRKAPDFFSFCQCKPFTITKIGVSWKFQIPYRKIDYFVTSNCFSQFFQCPQHCLMFMNLSTKLHARKSTKLIVLHFSEILRPKTITSENSTSFFMITPENSMLFLIYPWKFLLLFLHYYLKFCFLNHPPPFFFVE